MRHILSFLLLLSVSFSIDVDYYYGQGCPHCASVEQILDGASEEYDLNVTKYEVYSDSDNRNELFQAYDRFGVDIRQGGVPTTIIEGKTFIVGEMTEKEWVAIFDQCQHECPEIVQTRASSAFLENDSTGQLTIPVLVGAAVVDSINPCTIAVMILLISAVLYAKGRKNALVSGLVFAWTIFFMYLFYGFGILQAISIFQITRIFYIIVTVMALLLALLEIRAFIDYRPGLAAVEMPMFLRPHVKDVTSKALTIPAVITAAVLCSLFLVPCSSGPYLLVLGLLAKAATLQTVSYLLLYNFIFILPMLIITVAIYFGKTTVEKIGEARDEYIRYIHLISGIILFVLFFLMMYELQRVF